MINQRGVTLVITALIINRFCNRFA